MDLTFTGEAVKPDNGKMDKRMKKMILVCFGVTILILISMFVIWLNYAPIIDYPIHELQYIEISYRVDAEDCKDPEYQKMIIEDEKRRDETGELFRRGGTLP